MVFVDRTYLGRIAKIETERLRNQVMDLYDRYETACDLSEGPDKSRCIHWSLKAFDLSCDLEQKLKRYQV